VRAVRKALEQLAVAGKRAAVFSEIAEFSARNLRCYLIRRSRFAILLIEADA